MPAKLDRPPLDNIVGSAVAGVAVHPADEPLDSLTAEWAEGMLAMIKGPAGAAAPQPEASDALQGQLQTQGQAAAVIEMRLRAAGL